MSDKKVRKFKKQTIVPKSPKKITKVAESNVLELKFWNKKVLGAVAKAYKGLKYFKLDVER